KHRSALTSASPRPTAIRRRRPRSCSSSFLANSAFCYLVRQGVTADEFFAMDWLPRGAELIDGEIIVEDSPRIRQHLAVAELYLRRHAWATAAPGRGVCGNPAELDVPERAEVPTLWSGCSAGHRQRCEASTSSCWRGLRSRCGTA